VKSGSKRTLALALAGVVGGLGVACGAFSSNDPGADPGATEAGTTEAGTTEAGTTEAGAPEAGEAGPSGCALTSTPSLVASLTAPASKLQSNGEHVFWIEGGTKLERASLVDCAPTHIATGNISALAVDAKWIVWGDPGYHVLGRNDVGTPPATALTSISPSTILAGGTAFWIDVGHVSACDTPCVATTNAVELAGATTLAANAFRFFVFAPDADGGTSGDLWWQSIPLGANNSLFGPIATGQDPILLAANGASVFWVSSNGQVNGLPAGGGSAINLPQVPGARALAVDDAFVYVATPTSIVRAPVTGGVFMPVVTNEVEIKTLTVTVDALVWGTDTAIRRVHK
jgi:hypothetical protein